MKKIIPLVLVALYFVNASAQNLQTPDKLWGKLFEEIQLRRVLSDNKTFVDAIPKFPPAVILAKYDTQKKSNSFDLKNFVEQNFVLPATPVVEVKKGLSLKDHLEQLWDVLTRKADTKQPYSSLLPLPKPYIVPGGRFREIFYWDSYFTMLGLAESNRFDMIENMVDNFKWLIDHYGHIPNGNRNYFLSRSQPPFFAMMVNILGEKKGDIVYKKYYSSLEKEYKWWMQGEGTLKNNQSYRRVVKLPDGTVLNRYWDDKKAPREESYAEDVALQKEYKNKDGLAYTNLRASAESGWDFSSRWFADTLHLNTIETTNIIPVDLNCLLYDYEITLSNASLTYGNKQKSDYYKRRADKRRKALLKYCWNDSEKFFFDYDFKERHSSGKWSIAGVTPLFVKMATDEQAESAQKHIEEKFVKEGGVLTTIYHTGQQWDAPNGWAPLQYLAVKGLLNYKYDSLAKTIAMRWMHVNEKVFNATGKMMEKYNVENINLESGGGEYPTQDGFGWSNGVYLKFYQLFRKQ